MGNLSTEAILIIIRTGCCVCWLPDQLFPCSHFDRRYTASSEWFSLNFRLTFRLTLFLFASMIVALVVSALFIFRWIRKYNLQANILISYVFRTVSIRRISILSQMNFASFVQSVVPSVWPGRAIWQDKVILGHTLTLANDSFMSCFSWKYRS